MIQTDNTTLAVAQVLNTLIDENKALKAENERLKEVLELFRKTLADVAKMAINSDQEQIFEKCRDVLRDIYLEEKFRESFDKILHHTDTEKGEKNNE